MYLEICRNNENQTVHYGSTNRNDYMKYTSRTYININKYKSINCVQYLKITSASGQIVILNRTGCTQT